MTRKKPHKDLTGQRFERLTVKKYVGKSKWLCECECGNHSTPRSDRLTKGITKSCGCLQGEIVSKQFTKHGMADTRIYSIWRNMRQRCSNPNATKYEIYGGKGIEVCSEWMNFEKFCKWAMNNGYADHLSIDRIDSDKGYNPENCRWTTYKVQGNNTNQNHVLTYKGKTQNISQWAEELDMDPNTLSTRIARGWDIGKALTTPVIQELERDNKGQFINA